MSFSFISSFVSAGKHPQQIPELKLLLTFLQLESLGVLGLVSDKNDRKPKITGGKLKFILLT